MSLENRAVVLLSGGIDSATTLAVASKEDFNIFTLSFDYGQKHKVELESAKVLAKEFNAEEHLVVRLDMARIGGSALTGNMDIPKERTIEEISSDIPVTYVPARNTIFLSYALAWAEVLKSNHIFIGVNAIDYSGYPDCRPEYIKAFEQMANLATRSGVRGNSIYIDAPLMNLTKSEIIKLGLELGVDFSMTHSCYDPADNGISCGKCDSCIIRKKGFDEARITDPTRYVARV